jgi:hypothetical protein
VFGILYLVFGSTQNTRYKIQVTIKL